MALGTVPAKLAGVCITVLVAGDTLQGGALERTVDVACQALDLLVSPFEFMCHAAWIKCDPGNLTRGVA